MIAIALLALLGSAAASFAAIAVAMPWFRQYALAHPNTRSSHREPTPQGGGGAVVAATLAVSALLLYVFAGGLTLQISTVFVAVIVIASVGAADDIVALAVVPRLLLQAVCVAAVVAVLPTELRIFPAMPALLERALIFIGGLWFVNLVNFMDGIDWITVAEVVPITGALAIFGFAGALPQNATLISLALCGAMIGFAPFNKPVARLFLGDVGSLPIGLLLGWLLIQLAGSHLTAALLLPLYYVADATITLIRRIMRGEKFLQAHRSHFYQQAMDGGLSVHQIVGRIFSLNVILLVLAVTTIFSDSYAAHALALVAGCLCTALLLVHFARAKRA